MGRQGQMDGGAGQAPVERLLVIDLVYAHGVVIMQTIWGIGAETWRAGNRLSRTETIHYAAVLRGRLDELVPRLFPPAAAMQRPGSATVVPDPDDPAPAAGDLQAA